MQTAKDKTLIIIPTFNEAENVLALYRRIKELGAGEDILFVDDNSADGTRQIIEGIIQDDPRVHILKRQHKEGIARAYLAGFRWGLDQGGYAWFQEMDADLSHDPKYLADFEKFKTDNQAIVASRYIKEGKVEKWDFLRRSLSFLGCWYIRLILQCPLQDLTGGFNCWHRDVVSSFDLDKIISRGFVFQAELKFIAFRKGFKIAEFPYTFKEREKGRSKINYRIVIEGLLKPVLIRLNYRS